MNDRNVVLIGFMGTGKTSVGKVLARRLGRDLVDVDRLIEEREKRKIKQIFEAEGEAYFRKAEKEIIGGVSERKGIVITTGGGAVLDADNISALKKNGVLVCLSASPETIFKRVQHSENRPLLRSDDKLAEIRRLLITRERFYKAADVEVATDGQTPEDTAAHIVKLMEALNA